MVQYDLDRDQLFLSDQGSAVWSVSDETEKSESPDQTR